VSATGAPGAAVTDPQAILPDIPRLPDRLVDQLAFPSRATYRQMGAALRSVPGVKESSFDWGALPMLGDWEESFWVEGEPHAEHQADLPLSLRYGVEPDYLKLMQIPLLRGRFFTDADNEHSARVMVVDESFAEHYFPGQDPIGKHVHFIQESSGGPRTDEIVGVVGHIKQFGLQPDKANNVEAQYYEPFQQTSDSILRRVAGGIPAYVRVGDGVDPESVFPSIRRSLTQLDSQMVVDNMQSMQRLVADSIGRQRFAMLLFSIFAAGALLLASIGIYGVLSYVVGQRTREVGIRMALGAQKGDVMSAVLRDGAGMTLPGIGIGLVVALGMSRLMSAMLYGITPTDLVTFTSVPLVLCLVAIMACYLPARRAAKLDPMQALRAD